MSPRVLGCIVSACAASVSSADAAGADDWRDDASLLRLVSELDRPVEGYCLDVVGAGPALRTDMPLIGHNCVPGVFADRTVTLRGDGTIHFPAFEACVTAMGLNERALPGAALMLKPCGRDSPFLEADRFQRFEHGIDGRLRLLDTELCMTVGAESHATYSPDHLWRTLYMERCEVAPTARSAWRRADPLS